MRTELSDLKLLVVGRAVTTDGDHFYTDKEHGTFLLELSDSFSEATYLSFVVEDKKSSLRDDITRIDHKFYVKENRTFEQTDSHIARAYSLLKDIRYMQSLSPRTITYTFFPGFYSFFLSPAISNIFNTNIAYYGNDAVDIAERAEATDPLGLMKKALYPTAQKYVFDRSGLVFVRDPRLKRYEGCRVVFSNPVTSFEPIPVQNKRSELEEPITLLTVGKARKSKGYRYLVDSLSLLKDSSHEFESLFVGDGVERYSDYAEKKGVDDMITYVGYVDDNNRLAQIYRNSDIFVMPSISEGFPRVITEAMSMKLPIVSTKAGGIPHVLTNEEDAILTEIRNAQSIADGVLRVVQDERLRSKMSSNAYELGVSRIRTDPVEQHKNEIHTIINER